MTWVWCAVTVCAGCRPVGKCCLRLRVWCGWSRRSRCRVLFVAAAPRVGVWAGGVRRWGGSCGWFRCIRCCAGVGCGACVVVVGGCVLRCCVCHCGVVVVVAWCPGLLVLGRAGLGWAVWYFCSSTKPNASTGQGPPVPRQRGNETPPPHCRGSERPLMPRQRGNETLPLNCRGSERPLMPRQRGNETLPRRRRRHARG